MGCLPMLSCSHRFPFPATHSLGLAKLVSKRLDIESLSLQSLYLHVSDNRTRREDDMSEYTNVALLHISNASGDISPWRRCER